MKNPNFLIAGILALVVTSCQPDKPVPPTPIPAPAQTGILKMTLIPEWEGEALEFYTEYRNFMDYRTTVEMLKMYFGDLRLVDGNDTLHFKDVHLFDLANGSVSAEWNVAPGSWAKLRSMLGVPAALNYADPALYGSGHPLSVSNGTYWTWATGYRYVMFEGRYDPDPASTATLISSFAIHPGMEPSLLEFDLVPNNGITIVAGETTELVVRIAVDRFFHSDEFEIDLLTENTAHGNNLPLQWKFVNNVVRSMSLQ